jgi:hypothetical protein
MSEEDFPTAQDQVRDFAEFNYPELFYDSVESHFRRTGQRLQLNSNPLTL